MKVAIDPCPAPRMTRADAWKKRPCVLRYRAFRDEVRFKIKSLPPSPVVIFTIAMPESWSAKKKGEMFGYAHTSKPDIDNLCKALLDAMFDDDSHVWNLWAVKRWGFVGSIEIVTNPHTIP